MKKQLLKIIIPPREKSSILNDIEVVLSDYTVFAGENNSGKTNLIKGLISEIGEDNVIYIPAEKINALSEMKIGAKEDPMREAISKLLNIVLNEIPKLDGDFKNLFKGIESAFNFFDIKKTSLKLNSKDFEKADIEKMLKEVIASKILEHGIVDTYYGKEEKIPVNSVGQGIQRLIIVAIIQEIGKIKVLGKETTILFEEPEIYLHPKLKEKLFASLIALSEQMRVVVTTHDPYFIQLSKNQKIWHVQRDDKSGSTYIKEIGTKFLPEDWRSFNEINYEVFGVSGEGYLNELYGYLESKLNNSWRNVDKELVEISKEVNDKQRGYFPKGKMTMTSYIRHEIHHRTKEIGYSEEEIIIGIRNLQDIITKKLN